ncbi:MULTISPECIES: VOC family protein [Vibrio]|uniref:VOC family protein n=1 Tax=Vibrio TaxID=662 RepID=UPI00155EBE4A|nr:VOC family protein [Vibrio cholerae]NOF42599.1 glyoxalase [Vibrio cholerae]HDM8060909.1 VOC family protein [Vibrio harveyi]
MVNKKALPSLANLHLIYVSDVERSTDLYKELFNVEPVFSSPRYVAFPTSESKCALFALWSGGEIPDPEVQRYSEIGIMLKTNEDVNLKFETLKEHPSLSVIKEPYDEVFGRTFVVKDPDGHLIRISPLD